MNAGQNCASIERVYVERSVAEAFSAAVCKAVASLRPGVDVGPLATSAQLETVARHVRDAVDHGSEILVGGTTDGGTHFAPTVIEVKALAAVDAEHADALMCDETFGPVVPIAIVETAGEAIARANASRYGLTASIWSRDTQAAARLAKQLRAGVVTINNHGFTGAIPAAPWSGQGETGWGITNSPLALDALTRPRFVLVDRSRKRRELWWFPYTPALTALAMSMATLRCRARSLMERGRALRDLMIAMWRRSREI